MINRITSKQQLWPGKSLTFLTMKAVESVSCRIALKIATLICDDGKLHSHHQGYMNEAGNVYWRLGIAEAMRDSFLRIDI